jgi:hypothetical protein
MPQQYIIVFEGGGALIMILTYSIESDRGAVMEVVAEIIGTTTGNSGDAARHYQKQKYK